jgi:Uma2 family endonuclease
MTLARRDKPRATYADLEHTPEHMVAEIIGGELVLSPRPAPRHANAASVLGSDINGRFHGPPRPPEGGGWWILDESEIHLSGDAYVPDVAGWRRERLPKLPETAYFALAPDWVCEVLSPSTMRRDRMQKLPLYAHEGVAWAWLVDPIAHYVDVYRLDGAHWTLIGTWGEDHAEVDAAKMPPFDTLAIDLSRWWE